MATKTLQGRIVHKHDTAENWAKATSFKPLKGELIIYDVDDDYEYERFKIGDGNTLVNALPFSTAATLSEAESYTDQLIAQWVGTSTVANQITAATETKQDTITGAATTVTSSDLTADRAIVSNSSGKVAVSDVTATELGYLDGVTSNIQTQLNAKATTAELDIVLDDVYTKAEVDALVGSGDDGTLSATGTSAQVTLNSQWAIKLGSYIEGVGYNLDDIWIG